MGVGGGLGGGVGVGMVVFFFSGERCFGWIGGCELGLCWEYGVMVREGV